MQRSFGVWVVLKLVYRVYASLHGSIVYPLPAGFPLIYPTENSFGGNPDRSPLKGNPPFRGKPDAIDTSCNNRWTFGSGTLIRFHTRGVKMSEFRDSSRRNEERSERLRIFTTRRGAIARQASRSPQSGVELDNIMSSDVTFGVFVIPSSKKVSSDSGTPYQTLMV